MSEKESTGGRDHEKDFQIRIAQATASLRKGGILLTATDTVPGLAVYPLYPQAVEKIYHLKGRGWYKPLVWMAVDFRILSAFLEVPHYAEILIKRFWPGALTLIFRIKDKVSSQEKTLRKAISGNSLAVRIPSGDQYLLALLRDLGEPLAVTSVNRSGTRELTRWGDIYREFGNKLDYQLYSDEEEFLSAQEKGDQTASTIVDVRGNAPQIIRQGRIIIQ